MQKSDGADEAPKIKIGISSCLLGNKVRYDGGHQQNRYIIDTLGRYLDFIPVCPEVECGLPVPREAMRLEGDPAAPRLMTRKSRIDHTRRMNQWAKKRVAQLEKEQLCGFIFKKNSPSSGLLRVKVYNAKGMAQPKGTGMFASAFVHHFPRIPVEEDGRLNDPHLRENFIERIFALQRWRTLLGGRKRLGGLVAFHSHEKLMLLSHSPKHYRTMGKLVAEGKQHPIGKLFDAYEQLLVETLSLKATVAKHINVLSHIQGYFKKQLSADEKQELLEIIASYRSGSIPLIVPITLLKHYVRKYNQPYLSEQTYLNPHPIDLQLRNHA